MGCKIRRMPDFLLKKWADWEMLVYMSIRMKDWGMLQAPSAGVRIPVQGISGWGEAAQAAGSGISAAIAGGMALADKVQQVNTVGELAEFSGHLRRIGAEVQEELGAQDVQDWEYSWQQLCAPRFYAAVEELSPAAREQGRILAAEYSRRMSVQAWKERQLDKVKRARERWQQRVEEAVEAGDASAAERWLQSGAGVFVPLEQVSAQGNILRSRACAAGWRAALAGNPRQAMADYAGARSEALPQEREDARELQQHVEQLRQQERAVFARQLASYVKDGIPYGHRELEQAVQAGLLNRSQMLTALAQEKEWQPEERCNWFFRVDEVGETSGEQDDLRMQIVTAALPDAARRELLARLELAIRVAPGDRRALSRSLQRAYGTGSLGCPGDTEALERLAELQQSGLELLAQQGAEPAAQWLQQVSNSGNNWICFNNK